MNDDSKSRAEALLHRCFTQEKMAQLNLYPKFVLAVASMKSMSDAMDAIEIGQEILNPKQPKLRPENV
jgi:hypothetical protein